MVIPFYDSFIFNNTLKGFICVPQINFTKPFILIEENDLPFDAILKDKANLYAQKNKLQTINVKSVFYNRRKDFKTYLTFRCINNRSILNKPELEHMSSDQFCFQSFLEKKD